MQNFEKLFARSSQNSSDNTLIGMVRMDLVNELDSINQYQRHIDGITNNNVRRVLTSIRNEELTHIGELAYLWSIIEPEQMSLVQAGFDEAKNMIEMQNK